MKKTLGLLLVFIGVSAGVDTCYSEDFWLKTYGEENADRTATTIAQTPDGGYILAGYHLFKNVSNSGKLFILKLNNFGNIVWQKLFIDFKASVYTFIQNTDNGYVLTGAGSGVSLLNLDRNGNVIWHKTYGSYGFTSERGHFVQQTEDGGYILAGEYGNDIGLFKLNSTGDVVWQKNYGGFYEDTIPFLHQTTDGGYIVVGVTNSFGGVGRPDYWLLKLDSDGNISWQNVFGGSASDWPSCVRQTIDGGYIVVGSTKSYATCCHEDIWLLKLDSNGNVSWQKTYGGRYFDFAQSIFQTPDGGYLVFGNTDSFGDGVTNIYRGDIWVLRLDGLGNIIWQKKYGMDGREEGYSVKQTIDDGYVVAGSFYPTPGGEKDALVLKFDSDWVINGELPDPYCDIMTATDAIVTEPTDLGENTDAVIESSTINVIETPVMSEDSLVGVSRLCCYDTDDLDEDGIGNACDECPYDTDNDVDADDFCADFDNCPNDNNPYQEDYDEDGRGDICDNCLNTSNVNQEDTFPPQGNDIGDACDCESDFDCDGDVDGSDATTFKLYFGRNPLFYPCDEINPCRGDFDCDQDCDGTDASLFKSDFGRSEFNNACPACVVGNWCGY